MLPGVELGRRRLGPQPLVRRLRARGTSGIRRSDRERQRLRTFIRFVDRWFPDGGNCFRRTLIEIALDPVSASEPLFMALREHGGPGSGHAWLGNVPDTEQAYDAVFVA